MIFAEYAGVKLHYRIIGHGPRMLLAFHGYGQDSSYFSHMAGPLGNDYTIYAFDLFYHGKSTLSKKLTPLKKEVLADVFQRFLKEKKCSQFSLMGFSMGGKFVLSILEAIPQRIENVYLLAPDGISTSVWYNIATYPGFFQQLFKHTVVKPGRFFSFVNFMQKHNLADKGLIRFAGWQMDSLPKRLRVYRSWMGFRKLTFDVRRIATLINRHQIKFRLFIGEHDKVINGSRLQTFAKSLQNAEVVVLKSGHTFLLQEVAAYLHKEKARPKS